MPPPLDHDHAPALVDLVQRRVEGRELARAPTARLATASPSQRRWYALLRDGPPISGTEPGSSPMRPGRCRANDRWPGNQPRLRTIKEIDHANFRTPLTIATITAVTAAVPGGARPPRRHQPRAPSRARRARSRSIKLTVERSRPACSCGGSRSRNRRLRLRPAERGGRLFGARPRGQGPPRALPHPDRGPRPARALRHIEAHRGPARPERRLLALRDEGHRLPRDPALARAIPRRTP